MPDVFSGTFTRRFVPHFSRVGQHRCGIIHCGLIRLSRSEKDEATERVKELKQQKQDETDIVRG